MSTSEFVYLFTGDVAPPLARESLSPGVEVSIERRLHFLPSSLLPSLSQLLQPAVNVNTRRYTQQVVVVVVVVVGAGFLFMCY